MPLQDLAQAVEFGLNVLLQATGQHGLRVSDSVTDSLIFTPFVSDPRGVASCNTACRGPGGVRHGRRTAMRSSRVRYISPQGGF
jgi:hypothetical protein